MQPLTARDIADLIRHPLSIVLEQALGVDLGAAVAKAAAGNAAMQVYFAALDGDVSRDGVHSVLVTSFRASLVQATDPVRADRLAGIAAGPAARVVAEAIRARGVEPLDE